MRTWTILALLLEAAACDKQPKPEPPAKPDPPSPVPVVDTTAPPGPGITPTPIGADVERLATASNAFGFELWARLRSTSGNLAISPMSISTALAMTWGGAKGETAAEMQKALRIDVPADQAMPAWGKIAGGLQDKQTRLDLRIANQLFGEKTYKFETAYLDGMKAAYGAPLEPLDFANAPEPARAHINKWVEGHTERRIKDLLPPASITSGTRLVLVNAIYFLANWKDAFEKRSTTQQPFSVAAGKTRPAMMMRRRGSYRLAKADGVAMLELPYVGDSAAMLVVLPDRSSSLDAVEKSLDASKLAAWTQALAGQEVDVWLPRFLIDPPVTMELTPPLKALGMAHAFDPGRADFTGIANPPNPSDRLFIGAVFHKTFVKVDEKGTEAAAATAVVMAPGAGPPPPAAEFRADRPFLFFIVDKATRLVLFMGRVAEPKDS
jgi:serpin B